MVFVDAGHKDGILQIGRFEMNIVKVFNYIVCADESVGIGGEGWDGPVGAVQVLVSSSSTKKQ